MATSDRHPIAGLRVSELMLISEPVSLYAMVRAEAIEAEEQDAWCLMRWGKHYVDCTEFEREEAHRLRMTPIGGGYQPREEPT